MKGIFQTLNSVWEKCHLICIPITILQRFLRADNKPLFVDDDNNNNYAIVSKRILSKSMGQGEKSTHKFGKNQSKMCDFLTLSSFEVFLPF
jgi:hypothetical protein